MKYYVYFSDSSHKQFSFLKKGFRHVQVGMDSDISKLEKIFLNLDMNGISSFQLKSQTVDTLTAKCVGLFVEGLPADKYSLFPNLGTCVTFVKKLLNIHAWWVITPWQLYNYIKKNLTHMEIKHD